MEMMMFFGDYGDDGDGDDNKGVVVQALRKLVMWYEEGGRSNNRKGVFLGLGPRASPQGNSGDLRR